MAASAGYAQAGFMSGLDLLAAITQAQTEIATSEFAVNAMKANARAARRAGDEAVRVANFEIQRRGLEASALIGAQKTAAAAQGIDIGVAGSAQTAILQTQELSYRDAIMAQNNAYLERLGYQQQSIDLRRQAALQRASGETKAAVSLALGGLKAAEDYLRYAPSKEAAAKAVVPLKRGTGSGGAEVIEEQAALVQGWRDVAARIRSYR